MEPPIVSPQPSVLVRGALLLLLPLCALALYGAGQRYDPGLLDFKAKGATPGVAMPKTLLGLTQLGAVRRFGKENLYEYINGHAEYFIGAGFQGLEVVEYGATETAKQPLLVVDRYDLGKPLHAFGVLMEESGANAVAVDVGMMGFQRGQELTFIKGRYYLKVVAFTETVRVLESGQAVAAALEVAGDEAAPLIQFPDLGTVLATRFIKEDYRGMPFLRNVVERSFSRDSGKVVAFVSTGVETEVLAMTAALTAFVQKEGMTIHTQGRFTVVEDPYEGTWFYWNDGPRLLGIFAAPEADLLARLAGP